MLVRDAPEKERIGREQTILRDRACSVVEELDLPAAAIEFAGVARGLHHAVEREERRYLQPSHFRPPSIATAELRGLFFGAAIADRKRTARGRLPEARFRLGGGARGPHGEGGGGGPEEAGQKKRDVVAPRERPCLTLAVRQQGVRTGRRQAREHGQAKRAAHHERGVDEAGREPRPGWLTVPL